MTKKKKTTPVKSKEPTKPKKPVEPPVPIDDKGRTKPTDLPPTKEELRASLDNFEDEPSGKPKEPKEPTKPKEPVTKPTEPKEPKKPVKSKKKKGGPFDSDPEPEPKKPEIDYRKKYIASAKENIVVSAKNKKLTQAFDKASKLPEPTEAELKQEYSDWEDLSEGEQKRAKEALVSTRRFNALASVNKEFKNMDKWQKKVDGFCDDPQSLITYPKLEGKLDDLKYFASKPTRVNAPFDDIVKAFLYEESQVVKPRRKKKTQMFDPGTGGPTTKDPKKKSNKISVEEGARLKHTDYKKYVRLLKAGKIATEDVE